MKNISLVIILTFILTSCSTSKKIEALSPTSDSAKPLTYQGTSSFIGLPISLKLSEIESHANKNVSGLIFEDKNISDDNVMLKVWKEAPIQILEENGKLKTVLPLKVWAKVQYGKTILGVDLYDTREINLNGIVNLVSDVSLFNWKLRTNTQLKNIDWKESPSITIAGKNIPITYLINPTVQLFKKDIQKAIDQAIQDATDFKPEVLKALTTISTPFEVNKEYNTWFQITPQELYASDVQITKNTLNISMGLKSNMETFVGNKPTSTFDKNKIVLKTINKIPEKVQVNLAAISRYTDASNFITSNFKGEVFGDEKRKVTVQKVDLWHKSGKTVIALEIKGSLNGTIYLNGIPKYDPETKEIYFDEIDYILDTKNRLAKTANWLAQGFILNKIKENCKYSIADNLKEAEQTIKPYLTNYSPTKGVYVNGKLSTIDFNSIQLTDNAFVAFIAVNGAVNITIDGL